MHVAVLLGGFSSERDVSLSTGKAVAKAVESLGYELTLIDPKENGIETLFNQKDKIDIAFNALHGTFGEDGCIQGLLELLQIPYTHSGVEASAVGMDKVLTKRIATVRQVPTAKGGVFSSKRIMSDELPLEFPIVIKPLAEGSSVGVFIVKDQQAIYELKKDIMDREEWLVEEFVPGQELSVAVLDGKALGVVEIAPKDGFYDYKNKYTPGKTEYHIPARIPESAMNRAMGYASTLHQALGCRGVSRSDFRYNPELGDEGLFLLEINTHPGMTETSLVPKLAAKAGISFEQLVDSLLKAAVVEKQMA